MSLRKPLALFTAALATTALTISGLPHATASPAAPPPGPGASSTFWDTQLFFDNNGTPWSVHDFQAIHAKGITGAEIDLPWGGIEPQPGHFDFAELDLELQNAAQAGITLVPIFWQSGWSGSPASWETDREVTSDGTISRAPVWWDKSGQAAYFNYVTTTVRHIAHEAGYGGSILDYGFLDAQWDINGGAGGWAPADIAEFHDQWLPATFNTIAAFNAKYQTSYTDFSQVPAANPGQPLAAVYQQFRAWSVQDTYGRLTAQVRKLTDGPLYYYFGGHLANAPNYANNPDTFFNLARQYDVTIIVDAAQSPGLALTFGSLARAYNVKLAQEWTAPEGADALKAQAAQWVSNYGLGLPEGGGEDFFIHDGTDKDVYGYPIYTSWLPVLKQLGGSYPQQPVALYQDVSQSYGTSPDTTNAGPNMGNLENLITSAWNRYQSGFVVVTSQEIANHVVKLSDFKAVLPLNGVDANLQAYQDQGGKLLASAGQITDDAPAYAVLSSAGLAQVVPTVAPNRRSAQVVIAAVNASYGYHGSVLLQPAGLNLTPGTYHVVDGLTGKDLPQVALADGSVCVPADLPSSQLDFWRVLPGPSTGPGVQGPCPIPPGSGQTTVSATAGQSGGGMIFLGLGQTNHGADGNLTSTTQDGTPAVETWTSAQSGAPGSYVYLQVDPSSAVAVASSLKLSVTYWASDGQGFTPQYDAPGDPYHGGPSVTSPGGGGWTTATVTLDNTQLSEAQNMGADLRLAAKDSTQPLIISSVSLSVN